MQREALACVYDAYNSRIPGRARTRTTSFLITKYVDPSDYFVKLASSSQSMSILKSSLQKLAQIQYWLALSMLSQISGSNPVASRCINSPLHSPSASVLSTSPTWRPLRILRMGAVAAFVSWARGLQDHHLCNRSCGLSRSETLGD